MVVVDYLRKTNSATIVVPSFHTGPMGLLPETEVHLALMEGESGHEVVIRPFQSNADNLMQLSATMIDGPGVVGRLIDAISELGINVVNKVTTSIDHQNFHRVDMLLDWTTSRYPRSTSSSLRAQKSFLQFHSVFPITVQRNIELFESIIAHCEEVIHREDVNGTLLPVMNLREVKTPAHLQPYGPVTVKRHEGKAYHVELDLPAPLITRLRQKLKNNGEVLHYILLSETENRTLRAFFPRKSVVSRLVHVGFFHVDAPGALSSILGPLARAKFNIVTSVLRQNKDGQNVWEAVLEYRGSEEIPVAVDGIRGPEAGERLCSWVAECLGRHLESGEFHRLLECDLQIGLPAYPRQHWKGKVEFRSFLGSGSLDTAETSSYSVDTKHAAVVSESPLRVVRRVQVEPGLFLSYPKSARAHAAMVKAVIGNRYSIIDYQEPDSEIIVDQVLQRIEACDYFIGIWRPEGESKASISPWLHFEYGVAIALGKKTMIVHSEDLDSKIWKRINPQIAQPEFSDLYFESQTVPFIDAYCRDHFREEGQRVRNDRPPSHSSQIDTKRVN